MKYSKLKDVYKHLTIGKRSETDETYYYFSGTAPESMRSWFQELSSEYDDYSFADLDEYYRVLYTLAETINEHDEFTDNDFYSIQWESDYHSERLDWLQENLTRAQWYDNIKGNGADGIFELIGDMQDASRADFAQYIVNKLGDL